MAMATFEVKDTLLSLSRWMGRAMSASHNMVKQSPVLDLATFQSEIITKCSAMTGKV